MDIRDNINFILLAVLCHESCQSLFSHFVRLSPVYFFMAIRITERYNEILLSALSLVLCVCVLLFFSSSEFIGERTGNFDGIVHINMTHINENELYERL